LVSKFFDNKILQNPLSETRARQGFRRYRNKKISRQIRLEAKNASFAGCSANFILAEKSTQRTDPVNTSREATKERLRGRDARYKKVNIGG
jgi:hypothetical protein